jgi:pyrroloquinoline quinone biosynthesis protein D
MSGETKIRRNPQVVYRSVGVGGGVLLHLETGAYHGLNGIGSAVWELVDGNRSRREIVADLAGRIEDPPPRIEADVGAFLDGLRERDLISE